MIDCYHKIEYFLLISTIKALDFIVNNKSLRFYCCGALSKVQTKAVELALAHAYDFCK